MGYLQIIRAVSCGICFYAGIYHLLVAVRRKPIDRIHLTFALASLAFALRNFCEIFYNAAALDDRLADYLYWGQIAVVGYILGLIFLTWFVTIYTKGRPIIVPLVITSAWLVIFWVHLNSPYFYLFAEKPVFVDVTMPWGEIVSYGNAKMSIWGDSEWVIVLAMVAYFIWASIRQYFRGERREALMLGVAVTVYMVSFIHDIMLDYDMIDSIYILAQGFVVVIIMMSMTLSNEIIQTENELETLTGKLEQRVKERTEELSDAKQSIESALEELQESETRMDYMLRSTRMAVWEYDLQTRETATTDMFAFLLGYEPDELLVKSDKKWRGYKIGHQSLAAKLLNPEDAERYGEALGRMIEGNETFEVEYRLRMADGQWNWMRDFGKIVKWDDSGNPLVAYGVVMDNDRLKKLQLDLIDARDAAEAANRAKSVFLANMSHELRTPLNAILGHAQIMSRNPSLQPDQRIAVKSINKSGDHLLTLINSVLEMSKIEAGQAVLMPSCFSIDSLITDIVVMFHDRLKQKGIELDVEKDPNVIAVIEADRGKINQILINLLSNAVRNASFGKVFLRISMTKDSDDRFQLVFEVKDQGIGITADKLEKIFEPFVQLGNNSNRQSGTGLGLAISRQFAELMGGSLTAESSEGQGSIFRLTIPVIEATPAPSEMVSSSSRRITGIVGDWKDIKVLVVDDDPANREVLLGMIMPLGFEVQEAADGREAIDVFVDWSPDLIFMDIRMPVMDGIEAVQAIKSTDRGKTTPIIAVSASVFEEDRHKVLKSGADDFIAKPIQAAEFWDKIEKCLKVEFIYENEEQAEVDQLEGKPLAIEDITELSDELVQEMRAAIQGGYMDRLAELAGRAADRHPELSRHILKLVDQYDFDTLSRLFLDKKGDKS